MTHDKTKRRLWMAATTSLGLLAAAACNGGGESGPIDVDDPGGQATQWNPSGKTGACNVDALLEPRSYGAKVKTLLTGMPLDEAELTELEANPDALSDQIDGWLQSPEADAMLTRFFMTAFQQTSTDTESFFYLLGRSATNTGFFRNPISPRAHEMLNANLSESFARTAVELIREGRPFSDVLTTERHMMTTAQMVYLAYIDDDVVDDEQGHNLRTTVGHFPTITLLRDQAAAPPASEALDPSHPNFMKFWHPQLAGLDPSCNVQASQTIDTTGYTTGEWRIANATMSPSYFVLMSLFGRVESVRRHPNTCTSGASNQPPPLLDRADFSDWRMVTVSKPASEKDPGTLFYDLPSLRAANSIQLHTERLGFFTTPGFHSTWPNNEDNSSRVSINQTLIVALGASFTGEAVSDFSPPNLDEEHADPTSECYGCHQTLDPMRDYIRGSFTNFYGQQQDPDRAGMQADFVFGGTQTQGSGVRDLAQVLASHELFPRGWAQKLCFYANAQACPEGPELDRVIAAFVDSNLDFEVLVRELFASPLITGRACVDGVDAGTRATIARRSQFCAQLSHRLAIPDMCGIMTLPQDASTMQNNLRDAVASVPDDSFSRAVVEPVVIAETGLFTRANREAACVQAAQQGYAQAYGSLSAEDAMSAMVTQLMGLSAADPRHDQARAILEDHEAEALAAGKTETEALQSVFALACMSPGAAGVGF